MNVRRTWAVGRKEFLHVLRDPRSLALGVAIPALMIILFGYALTLDVNNVPLVVWDQNRTALSRDFISRFGGSPYFKVVNYFDSYRDLERAIDTREAMVAMIVPMDFQQRVTTGRNAPVQLIVDGSDANTATIAIGYADVIAQVFSEAMMAEKIQRMGLPRINIPLDVRSRVWFNADLESKNYIVPGLIAVIMMVIAALLTSLTVAREWERGTMEQLISTPVKGPELILGKLLPYFAIGLFDVAVAMLMGQFLFHVPLRGNAGLLFGLSALFLVGVLSMGMLISITAKSQLLASQIAMTSTFLPSFLLSGFIFAIPNMPWAIRMVTYVVPAKYFISILRGIYLKGIGLELLAGQGFLLIVFGAMMVVIANVRFKKKL